MEENGSYERLEGEDGQEKIRVSKIPLEDMLNILENLYEQGVNFVDFEFFVDPQEIQSTITISTRPEYISTPEELEAEKLLDDEYDEEDDDEDEEDDILSRIRKEQEDLSKQINEDISDDDIEKLL